MGVVQILKVSELDVPFTFKAMPSFMPVDLRPEWRISLLALILYKCCRQYTATMTRLQVLTWSLRTHESKDQLLSIMSGQTKPDDVIVRYDPVLDRVIDLAVGEELVSIISGNKIILTGRGVEFAKVVDEMQDCLFPERAFLNRLGSFVTEKRINEIIAAVVSK